MRKLINIAESFYLNYPIENDLTFAQQNDLYQRTLEAVNLDEFRAGYDYDGGPDDLGETRSRAEIKSSLLHYTEELARRVSDSHYDIEYTDGYEAVANKVFPWVCDELEKFGYTLVD